MQPPGCTCQDQEKPLVEAQEDEADAVPIPCPEPEYENVDNTFQPFSLHMKDMILYLFYHFESIKIQRSFHIPDI